MRRFASPANAAACLLAAALVVALIVSLDVFGGDSRLAIRQGDPALRATTDLFRLEVRLNGSHLPDEWFSPGTGSYSLQDEGTTYWFDGRDAVIEEREDEGGARSVYHGENGYLRVLTGSNSYDRPGAGILAAYLSTREPIPALKASVEDGHSVINVHDQYVYDNSPPAPLNYHVVVMDRISRDEARRRGLFGGAVQPTATTWVSRPGRPSRLGLTAYWLGENAVGRTASLVVEQQKRGQDSYLVWYVDPDSTGCPLRDGVAGIRGYWPGIGHHAQSCREWEVQSWAPDHPVRQGAGTTKQITLANGESAELIRLENFYPFYVRTKRALMEVSPSARGEVGEDDAAAYLLRPVG